jgi:hypothetical protein
VDAAQEWERYFQERDHRRRDGGVIDVQRGRSQLFRTER